jgi:hypothetical protein
VDPVPDPPLLRKSGSAGNCGPLIHVSTIEELLDRKSSGSCLENREYGRKDHVRLLRDTPLSPQKLALISPTSSGRSVGTISSRTKATELLVALSIHVFWGFYSLNKFVYNNNNNKSDGNYELKLHPGMCRAGSFVSHFSRVIADECNEHISDAAWT